MALTVLQSLSTYAEESHPVLTAIGSTTLNGYVDTSAAWVNVSVPLNDNFTNAIALTALHNDVIATTVGATVEPGEPVPLYPSGGSSVWFKWTAPFTGRAKIGFSDPTFNLRTPAILNTASDFSSESVFLPGGGYSTQPIETVNNVLQNTYLIDMIISDGGYTGVIIGAGTFTDTPPPFGPPPFKPFLALYAGGSLETLQAVGRVDFNDFSSWSYQMPLDFEAIEGRTYYILLDDRYHVGGVAHFWIAQTPPPINDDFANALSISSVSAADLQGNLSSATVELDEPNLGAEFSGGSAWFHWKAGTYGPAQLMQNGEFPVAVFKGSALTNLVLVSKSFAGTNSFFAEEGQDYWIAVYRAGRSNDEFSIHLSGPVYRTFDVDLATLMPAGRFPLFYGLRGHTLLLYAQTDAGRTCVEIEPIKDGNAVLLRRPEVVNNLVQVVTIDAQLPAPHVEFVIAGASRVPKLVGYPGQTCAISHSRDLLNWSSSSTVTLHSRIVRMTAQNAADDDLFFYRVTQSFPVPNP